MLTAPVTASEASDTAPVTAFAASVKSKSFLLPSSPASASSPSMVSAAISVPFAMVSFVALAQAVPFNASLTLHTTSVTLSTAALAVSLTFPTISLPLSTTFSAPSLIFSAPSFAVSLALSTAPETSEARSKSFLLPSSPASSPSASSPSPSSPSSSIISPMVSFAISVPFIVAFAQALPFSESLTLQTKSVTLSTAAIAPS